MNVDVGPKSAFALHRGREQTGLSARELVDMLVQQGLDDLLKNLDSTTISEIANARERQP